MNNIIEKVNGLQRTEISQHLLKLNNEDRYSRFGQILTNERITDYVMKINLNRDLAFCIRKKSITKDGENDIIAFAHVAFYSDNGWIVADLGLSVDKEIRSKGLGKDLIFHCIGIAKQRLVKDFYIHTMRSNAPMYSLMKKISSNVILEKDELTLKIKLNELTENHQIFIKTIKGCEIFEKISVDKHYSILMVHGAGGDGWQFRQYLMPYFASKKIHSIAVSLPNHGESQNTSWDIDEYMEIIDTLMKECKKYEKVMLVGHSMGGWLVQKYASITKEKIDNLVLLSSVPPYNYNSMNNGFLYLIENELQCILAKNNLSRLLSNVKPIDIENIVSPVICVAGIDDKVIPMNWMKKTSFHYRAPLYQVKGGHNLMTSKNWKQTAEILFKNMTGQT